MRKKNSKFFLIAKRIDEAHFGSSLIASDFTDLAEYETAKRTITRLEKKETLLRVLRGVCLFHKWQWKEAFAFKGGVSLTKVYSLIDRFLRILI